MCVLFVWWSSFLSSSSYLSTLQFPEILKGFCVHFPGCCQCVCSWGCVFLTVFGGLCSFSLCLLETFFQFCSEFLVLIWLFCSLLFAVEPRVVFHVWFRFGSSVLYLFGLLYFFWFLRNLRIKAEHSQKMGNPNIKVKNTRYSREHLKC